METWGSRSHNEGDCYHCCGVWYQFPRQDAWFSSMTVGMDVCYINSMASRESARRVIFLINKHFNRWERFSKLFMKLISLIDAVMLFVSNATVFWVLELKSENYYILKIIHELPCLFYRISQRFLIDINSYDLVNIICGPLFSCMSRKLS